MATTKNNGIKVDSIAAQFQGLDMNQPGQWPVLPKLMAFLAVFALVVALGYFLWPLSGMRDELEQEQSIEPGLKDTYRAKLAKAEKLDELRKQKIQVQEYVQQLEKKLPGKAEMDALLADINQAGVGRGMAFELFRPGDLVIKDYYAELPISIRVSGSYHDIGAFTSDIANLSRIVTLHNLTIKNIGGSDRSPANLSMDAVARTYRYLDPAEVEKANASRSAQGVKK